MHEQQLELLLVSICIILLILILLGGYVYAWSICCIRRFHKVNHLLILNVSLAVIIATKFWTIYVLMSYFYPNILWTPQSCLSVLYGQTM
ncbi:unnamed protein product, partial [Rotaria sp. Silwood1]